MAGVSGDTGNRYGPLSAAEDFIFILHDPWRDHIKIHSTVQCAIWPPLLDSGGIGWQKNPDSSYGPEGV